MSIFNTLFKPNKFFNSRKGSLGLEEFNYYITKEFGSISREDYDKALDLYYNHKDEEMLAFLNSLRG